MQDTKEQPSHTNTTKEELKAATQVYSNDINNTSPPPDNTKSNTILIILISMLLMMMSARFLFRRKMKKLEQKGPETLNRQKLIRDDIDQLIVNLQDISRENIAKLDNKIRVLNQLVIEADMKVKELTLLLKTTQNGAISPTKTERNSNPRPINPLHEKVFKCADNGMDVITICSETGLEKGEVELILSMRQLNQ